MEVIYAETKVFDHLNSSILTISYRFGINFSLTKEKNFLQNLHSFSYIWVEKRRRTAHAPKTPWLGFPCLGICSPETLFCWKTVIATILLLLFLIFGGRPHLLVNGKSFTASKLPPICHKSLTPFCGTLLFFCAIVYALPTMVIRLVNKKTGYSLQNLLKNIILFALTRQ